MQSYQLEPVRLFWGLQWDMQLVDLLSGIQTGMDPSLYLVDETAFNTLYNRVVLGQGSKVGSLGSLLPCV